MVFTDNKLNYTLSTTMSTIYIYWRDDWNDSDENGFTTTAANKDIMCMKRWKTDQPTSVRYMSMYAGHLHIFLNV